VLAANRALDGKSSRIRASIAVNTLLINSMDKVSSELLTTTIKDYSKMANLTVLASSVLKTTNIWVTLKWARRTAKVSSSRKTESKYNVCLETD